MKTVIAILASATLGFALIVVSLAYYYRVNPPPPAEVYVCGWAPTAVQTDER
ncbi:hypothetical protein [Xanthomonas phage XPV1]|uniref:Uncharacterized protein n=1 Tax=Xanthomonas phage XPV1 TaxID=2099860 RepID=A0A3S7I6A4_9CAUD|nr:hypothetical protein KEM12_gp12 [Xanthomonas phage XPV1]AVO24176.1 hypothetical protein [Xanthomonas phage XPV1]